MTIGYDTTITITTFDPLPTHLKLAQFSSRTLPLTRHFEAVRAVSVKIMVLLNVPICNWFEWFQRHVFPKRLYLSANYTDWQPRITF